MKDYGVKLAIDMVKKLTMGGIYGVNFCTLNLEKSVQLILEGLQWTVRYDDHHSNKLINVSTRIALGERVVSAYFPLDGRPQTLIVRNRADDISP